MIEHTERGDTRPDPAGYASADALLADLRLMEDELIEGGRPELATALIRPVRREVESFRFSTVRLDVRENTTKLNAALADLWRTGGGTGDAPEPGSEAWRALAGGGAGPPAHAGRARSRALGGVRGDVRHVPARPPAARGDRPRGLRRLRAQHDAERERRAGRVPAGQDRRAVRRHGGHRELHPPDRAAVRDDRGSAARAGHHAGAAQLCPWSSAACARRAGCRR